MTHALPLAESLTIEFKSDRKKLSDNDLAEALVCLANADGGELWLGVEDDGKATGLHADHRQLTGLPGLIAARMSPSLAVRVDEVDLDGISVARISVQKARTVVATASGVYLRRRLKHDGTPECAPMLPHERDSRLGGNPPIFSSRQKWNYAANANFCIGVMPPSAILGRSWL